MAGGYDNEDRQAELEELRREKEREARERVEAERIEAAKHGGKPKPTNRSTLSTSTDARTGHGAGSTAESTDGP